MFYEKQKLKKQHETKSLIWAETFFKNKGMNRYQTRIPFNNLKQERKTLPNTPLNTAPCSQCKGKSEL